MEESRIKDLWERQDKLEERIRVVETQQAGTIVYIKEIKADLQEIKDEIKKISPSNIKSYNGFWQTDSGKFIIRTLCVIGVALTFAAIGLNYFKEYLAILK